jgi:predicted nucleotidyltransferase
MGVQVSEATAQLRRRAEERARAGELRAARPQALLPAAAAMLRERYGAQEIVLFGSLATGTANAESDVDLAARGVRSDDYFAALADLMAVFGGPVDLVRLELAPPSLMDRIAAEGKPL